MENGPFKLIASFNLDREVLVVGGGSVGERKISTLLACGASVRLVSPTATPALRELALSGSVVWEAREAGAEDFRGHRAAVLAVPRETALSLLPLAHAAGCLADVCADGILGDFALCAQFERDGCYIGVSSGGTNPGRAAAMKREISRCLSLPRVLLSRASPLASAQTGKWRDALSEAGVSIAIRTVSTHGDADRESDLASFGFGAFVKALEDEMLAGRGDGAVHSLKDMPSGLPKGCVLASVLPRGSARDLLITAGTPLALEDLPAGARVGTSSTRRRAQTARIRPDLKCLPCRGNVGTRLEKLRRGEYDALILAEAGVERLGLELAAVPLPFVTAPGQGILALELIENSPIAEAAWSLNHLPTWYEAVAEREVMRLSGLGCSCPLAARAVWRDGVMELTMELYLHDADGVRLARHTEQGSVNCDDDALALAGELWRKFPGDPVAGVLLGKC